METISLPSSIFQHTVEIPSDKSISHRALIFSSIVKGTTKVEHFLDADDTVTTMVLLRKLGADIAYDKKRGEVTVKGVGLKFKEQPKSLWMKESGTTIRLIAGLLAGQGFPMTLKAAPSLKKRPMGRIIAPLTQMGADIKGVEKDGKQYPDLRITPVKKLLAISYVSPIASAQIKSCVLLAGLHAKGVTSVREPEKSRDHTERALKLFGAELKETPKSVSLLSSKLRSPKKIFIPGDISSAAFFMALGAMRSEGLPLVLPRIGINPTRDGFLKVMKRMGAKIELENVRADYFEPYADMVVYPSDLKGVTVKADELPSMIDELPMLFTVAAFAEGKTIVEGAKELKVKESDRIEALRENLVRMGARFEVIEYADKNGEKDYRVEITGGVSLKAIGIHAHHDHRVAMSMLIAHAAMGERDVRIDDVKCINKSFPTFVTTLQRLGRKRGRS